MSHDRTKLHQFGISYSMNIHISTYKHKFADKTHPATPLRWHAQQ